MSISPLYSQSKMKPVADISRNARFAVGKVFISISLRARIFTKHVSFFYFMASSTFFMSFITECLVVMNPSMLRSRQNLQITYSVVVLDPINVVYMLSSRKWSIKILLHHIAMFIDLFSIYTNNLISCFINSSALIMPVINASHTNTHAISRAEPLFRIVTLFEGLTTSFANNCFHNMNISHLTVAD